MASAASLINQKKITQNDESSYPVGGIAAITDAVALRKKRSNMIFHWWVPIMNSMSLFEEVVL